MKRNAGKTYLGLTLALLTLPTVTPVFADEKHGVDLSTLDRKVKPADDFYEYANGGWLARTKLPADRPSAGAFEEIQERNNAILHAILEKSAKDTSAAPGSTARKVGDFYRTGLDEKKADLLGAKPLQPLLDQINAISDSASLLAEMARLHRDGVDVGFGFGVGQDDRDSAQQIAQVAQAGLGLPDRDYYLNDDPKTKDLRAQYAAHVTKMLALLDETPDAAKADTDSIMALETRLAKASLARVQMRDPVAMYHKMTVAALQTSAPQADWNLYFTTLGAPNPGPINVSTPDFMKEFAKSLNDVPLPQWKAYLRWHLLSSASPYLSKPFTDENFRFGSALAGMTKQSPRWRRVMGVTEGALGEALGQLYVDKAFPPAAKQRALDMVLNLKSALRDRITTLDWMGDATKTQALRKIDAIQIKIGYPDKWRDYSALVVGTDSYVQNVFRANEFGFQRELDKIGKPVDRTEWGMTPPTVNAYYNPNMNEIVFPAGILQPPFFDPKADDASNYGAIGAVIGHEMTHGFDDQGRQYDADGNLKDWWTPEDAKRFTERSKALVKQYGAYVAIDDVKVNGELTQGENIADLGGLKIAYIALEKSLEGKPRTKIGGFTPEQRFFLAFAQAWRSKQTPKMERLLATLDAHSPNRWRVIGTLTNMPAFIQAFGASSPGAPARLGSGSVDIW